MTLLDGIEPGDYTTHIKLAKIEDCNGVDNIDLNLCVSDGRDVRFTVGVMIDGKAKALVFDGAGYERFRRTFEKADQLIAELKRKGHIVGMAEDRISR